MFGSFALCCFCCWSLVVFDSEAVQSVSVTEGEAVTLQSYLTQIQLHDLITWRFERPVTQIAQLSKEDETVFSYGGDVLGFRGRLKLDDQTGSLTIINTRTTDSGDYSVIIKTSSTPITHSFSVSVYASKSQPGLISAAVVGSLLIVAAVVIYCIYRRLRKTHQDGTDQTRNEDITYADPTFFKQKEAKKQEVKPKDEVLYADVVNRN